MFLPIGLLKGGTLAVALGVVLGLVLMSHGSSSVRAEAYSYGQEPVVPVVVTFSSPPRATDARRVRSLGGRVDHVFHLIPAIAARLPQSKLDQLYDNPRVVGVDRDTEVFALQQQLPWGVDQIDAEVVHDRGNRGEGVKVAIVDTGIDLDHPDLVVEGHISFVSGSLSGNDGNGHGTHVAGTVGARNNNIGVVGVAPGVRLFAVRVLDDDGRGTWSGVVQGVEWAVDNGMAVANMSLGSSSNPGSFVASAMNAADNAGVLLVAAAGNSGNVFGIGDNVTWPARYPSVMAVAATTQSDQRAIFSSTGTAVELAAPGVSIRSTWCSGCSGVAGDYRDLSGTSMAAPHVSGTAALVLANGDLTDLNGDGLVNNRDLRLRLRDTADDLPPIGWDDGTGFGLVDADEAAPQVSNLRPLADAGPDQTVFDIDGDGVEAVTLNGSGSTDPNGPGDIVSYQWTEGNTILGTSAIVAVNLAVGSHTVVLTVTDTAGNADGDVVVITVSAGAPNQVPVANAGPDQTVSLGGAVTLNGSASFDPDGSITGHSWSFGDGGTASVAVVVHTYAATGTYTATLTVTDNEGASDGDSVVITVVAGGPNTIHVQAIDMRLVQQFGGWRTFATAAVKVRDQSGNPVSGVLVQGHWEEATSDTESGNTSSTGKVTFKSNVLRKPPSGTTFVFVVDDLSKDGSVYDAAADNETQDSVAV